MSESLTRIGAWVDELLGVAGIQDYPGAMNGIQFEHDGPVRKVAAAVDASLRTITGAVEAGANLLVVHHGLFWGGVQPVRGRIRERFRLLLDHDIAIYSAHLPLDMHPALGNNALMAAELGLVPDRGFARHGTQFVGLQGSCDMETATLAERVASVARREGGALHSVGVTSDRRSRRWAICTGAGASSDTLQEAAAAGVDTLIVGEGPHHTAVEAEERGIALLYAGHYATETYGVRALGEAIANEFDIPWIFVPAPTGT